MIRFSNFNLSYAQVFVNKWGGFVRNKANDQGMPACF